MSVAYPRDLYVLCSRRLPMQDSGFHITVMAKRLRVWDADRVMDELRFLYNCRVKEVTPEQFDAYINWRTVPETPLLSYTPNSR